MRLPVRVLSLIGVFAFVALEERGPALALNYSEECIGTAYPSSGPCKAPSLTNPCPEVTDFQNKMTADYSSTWSMTESFFESGPWADDWREEDLTSRPGLDDINMDAHTLAVYSGHGVACINTATNHFCEPDNQFGLAFADQNSSCQTSAGSGADDMHFGEWSTDTFGAHSGIMKVMVLDACCSLETSEWNVVWAAPTGMMSRLDQGLGFRNSTDDSSSRLGNWVNDVHSGKGNKDAWLDVAEACSGWFCSANSPIVITKGTSATSAQSKAATMDLTNTGSTPFSPFVTGAAYWMYWIDHGNECATQVAN